MRLKDFIDNTVFSLEALYPEREAWNIVSVLLEKRLGLLSWEQVLRGDDEMDFSALDPDVRRLLRGEPLQYVICETEFYGRTFKVDPSVLIPRPETELLVEKALELIPSSCARVLDLCTGSGAIAWTLALERSEWKVDAVDISTDALRVAEGQFSGAPHDNRPRFLEGDVLDAGFLGTLGEYDLIVSNPPYIMEREKPSMRAHVLDYEPPIALFVPDDDPLVFYGAIARGARTLLRAGGCGIVECNELLCGQTACVFEREGLKEVSIKSDLSSKMRFVSFFKGV